MSLNTDQATEFALGTQVTHPILGTGKVVGRDSNTVSVYFKLADEPLPERRVKSFRLPGAPLDPVENIDDPELDNIPSWKDGTFQRFKTSLTLDHAKKTFLSHFPGGFSDPEFHARELDYKRAAHLRFSTWFLDQSRAWIERGDADAIARGLDFVYGDSKVPAAGADTRLNILYQRVEEPAYFDALRNGGDATVEFARAALDFVRNSEAATFDRYLNALRALPARKGGARVDTWTSATWLPFIADPARHIVVKPTIVQAFASIRPFEIGYKAEVNFRTYHLTTRMASSLLDQLKHSELNPDHRSLDFLDIQSFMWVVERYGKIQD